MVLQRNRGALQVSLHDARSGVQGEKGGGETSGSCCNYSSQEVQEKDMVQPGRYKGGSRICGGAGRCHKHYTAHPRRNKVRGGAQRKEQQQQEPRGAGQRSQFTGCTKESWCVQKSAAGCSFTPPGQCALPLPVLGCMFT